MPKYAYVVDGVAQDVVSPPDGFSIDDCFHPDLISSFIEVPDEVVKGSKLKSGKWSIPKEDPTPSPPPVTYPVVTPETFLMFFTSAERIAIKRLVPTDEVIDDWWSIVNNPKLTEVDLNLESAREAIDYLITLGILTEARKAEILAGIRK